MDLFKFKLKGNDERIFTCKVSEKVAEITYTEKDIFHSVLCSINHLTLSIKKGDWIKLEYKEEGMHKNE